MAKNILICDDAAFMRMMIKDILTNNRNNIFRKYKKNRKIFWNNAWQIVLNEVQWRQQKTREEKTKEETKRKNKNLQNMEGGPMGY